MILQIEGLITEAWRDRQGPGAREGNAASDFMPTFDNETSLCIIQVPKCCKNTLPSTIMHFTSQIPDRRSAQDAHIHTPRVRLKCFHEERQVFGNAGLVSHVSVGHAARPCVFFHDCRWRAAERALSKAEAALADSRILSETSWYQTIGYAFTVHWATEVGQWINFCYVQKRCPNSVSR